MNVGYEEKEQEEKVFTIRKMDAVVETHLRGWRRWGVSRLGKQRLGGGGGSRSE